MTLSELALASGSSLERLATRLQLRIEFLENTNSGFQPLPVNLIDAIASDLGVEATEVRASVPRLTTNTSRLAREPRPLPIPTKIRSVVLSPVVT